MKRLSALILFFAGFWLLATCFFPAKSFAQTKTTDPQTVNSQVQQSNSVNQYAAPVTNPDVPKNLHTYTQSVIIEVMAALVCQLSGIDPINPNNKCLGVDPRTGNIGFVENGGGVVGIMGSALGMLYTPPVHTRDFIAYASHNFGLVKPTYAQGVGLSGLSPLFEVWSRFRDIAYLLFIVIFVVIGVAIMLRVRIDPRTVMTIQNQIPKIIIALLLVTFSMAIAGFLIDVMWVMMYLIFNIFKQPVTGIYTTPFGLAQDTFGIFKVTFDASWDIGNVIGSKAPGGLLVGLFSSVLAALVTGPFALFTAIPGIACGIFGSIPFIGGGVKDVINFGTSLGGILPGGACDLTDTIGKAIIGSIVGLIAFLVILIALLWALFRLWFALLQAYVFILVDIMFAPFWIVAGLFPGSTISFTSWLRSLASNLAAFPATVVLFLVAKTLMDTYNGPGDLFVAPFIGNPNGERFGSIIALGVILTTPKIVQTMREALKAPKVDLSSIGQAIGVGGGYPIAVGKGIGQTMTGAEEYRVTGYDKEKGVTYGKVGKIRAFGRKFGVG